MVDAFLKKYNLNLTEQQKKAVEAVEGPTLLLAVPGSGKTTTLVARLGYMIYEKGIAPENILVLTYTVAATKDMSARFEKIFGSEMHDRLEFRTINGVSAKIILYYSNLIHKKPFELESDEKKRFLRIASIYQRVQKDYPTEGDLQEISTAFTYIKNMMLSDKEIAKFSLDFAYNLEEIYKEYCISMQRDGVMDYDDQMKYAYNILLQSPETLRYYRDKFRYICVDEAQDTSKIQHVLINLLAGDSPNLFEVGDEDQSIYGFRASYSQALLSFEEDHKNATVLVMEENFRSTSGIVDTADRFIQKNYYRHKKSMHSFRGSGEEVKLKELPSRSAQYEYLVQKLTKTDRETAVLYRNNDSVLPLVDKLDRLDVKFRVKNAELLFFTNRIIVDILDIIRFSYNIYDTDLFMKIYYKMNLYLTKNEAVAVCKMSSSQNISVFQALHRFSLNNSFKSDRVNDFEYEMKAVSEKKPHQAISYVITMTGYRDYLNRNKIKDNKSYILKEIAKNCEDFNSLLNRLDYLKNLISSHNVYYDSNIILSTIHSSKGLEYDTVYMLDVLDGVLPETISTPRSSKAEKMAFEEERRVFYVGITRAKNRLILLDTGESSRFIDEALRSFSVDKQDTKLFNKQKKMKKEVPEISVSFEEFCSSLLPGKVLNHEVFGEGVISKVNIPYVSIQFSEKEKTFSARYLYDNNLVLIQ